MQEVSDLASSSVFNSVIDSLVLELESVGKHYGRREVLRTLTLQLRRGECLALLGPNGAGKSTTVGLALGLTHANAGDVRLLGLPMPHKGFEARRRVGVVPQYDSLDPDFTVFENLVVFGRYFAIDPEDLYERAIGLLNFVELDGRRNDPVSALSGGMRRRLMLARALVNKPDVLFLDEPTTGLDPQAKRAMWDGLLALKRQGMGILLTSHDMDEAERLADRVAVLDKGQLVAMDTVAALITQHVGVSVLEVWGGDAQRYLADRLRLNVGQIERRGSTLYLTDDFAGKVLERIRADKPSGVECLFRPGNLEDVFFRMTGRALDEA